MSAFPEGRQPTCQFCHKEKIHDSNAKRCRKCADHPGWHVEDDAFMPRGYEGAWLEWHRYIGQAKERYTGPPKRPVNIGRQRVGIAGDFHIPFHDKAALATLFEREKEADLLIVNGDLQDFYSISRFTKYEHVPIEQEFAEVTLF